MAASVFWDRRQGRARIPWLILLPLVGAFVAAEVADALAYGRLPIPVVALLTSAAPTLAAIALVIVSRRLLRSPRRMVDYGLGIDRRWLIDLTAGLAIGLAAVAIPYLVAIIGGAVTVVAVLDAGELALWPGLLLYIGAMLLTGLWEELVLRGVFLSNAADGLRRWLSPRRAVAGGLALSALVFGLGHLGQAGVSVALLTFILSGLVLGVLYLASGNLALVIGAHAAFNIATNLLFNRSGEALDALSVFMRIEVDPASTLLRSAGLLDVAAFLLVGLLGLSWLRHSRADRGAGWRQIAVVELPEERVGAGDEDDAARRYVPR